MTGPTDPVEILVDDDAKRKRILRNSYASAIGLYVLGVLVYVLILSESISKEDHALFIAIPVALFLPVAYYWLRFARPALKARRELRRRASEEH